MPNLQELHWNEFRILADAIYFLHPKLARMSITLPDLPDCISLCPSLQSIGRSLSETTSLFIVMSTEDWQDWWAIPLEGMKWTFPNLKLTIQ